MGLNTKAKIKVSDIYLDPCTHKTSDSKIKRDFNTRKLGLKYHIDKIIKPIRVMGNSKTSYNNGNRYF